MYYAGIPTTIDDTDKLARLDPCHLRVYYTMQLLTSIHHLLVH